MSADAKPYTVAEWTLARGNDALNYERMTATVRALEAATKRAEALEAACAELRAALECGPCIDHAANCCADWCATCHRAAQSTFDALSSDVGKGWASPEQVLEWRQLLWLRHGCSGLYGDDGEMQCGACLLDFGRMSPKEIADQWAATAARVLGGGR